MKSIYKSFLLLFIGLFYSIPFPILFGQIPTRMGERAESRTIPQRSATAVTPEQAREAALDWLNGRPNFIRDQYTATPEMVQIKDRESTRTIAYVMQLEPRGYIVITPDNELNPIIAYSENSRFDTTESPDNMLLHLLRSDITERLQALEAGAVAPIYRTQSRILWESTVGLNKSAPQQVQWAVEYGPFLSSQWSQSTDGGTNATFNYYTPLGPDGSSGNYVCGCVATALGQILNYYEWPGTGTGSYGYTWDNGSDPSEILSADFGGTTYDWPNILDVYHDGGKSAIQRQGIGLLTFHCGVSVDMEYASDGSGASPSRVAFALRNHFRGAAEYVVNEGDFYDRLYSNIVNQRAGELAIYDTVSPAGHAVVVDGVQHDVGGTKYYHLNMGWSGSYDAWYDIENPFTTSSYIWDTVGGCVLDIIPTPDLNDPGNTTVDGNVTVSWDVSDHLNADQYELQQALLSTTLGDFTENVESGSDDWLIDFNWETSTQASHGGASSFRGYFTPRAFISGLELNKVIEIDESTSITYWWRTNYFKVAGESTNARFEISTDGYTWTTLRTYTDASHASWTQETISAAELAVYAGETAFVRFIVDHPGVSYYDGDTYNFIGFFVDDFAANDCYIGDWSTVDNSILTESKGVTITESGDYYYRVRANTTDWWEWSDVEGITADLAVATPTFDPEPGTYGSAQNVTISCATTGAAIYYTMDGSDPTESSSLYSDPVSIAETTTLKAKAYKSGWTASGIASGLYELDFIADTESISGTGTYLFNEVGEGGDGHQVSINFTSLTGSGDVTVTQVNMSPSTPPWSNTRDFYWQIEIDGGITGFIADVAFYYLGGDVSGLTECDFRIYRSPSGSSWNLIADQTTDVDNHKISCSGITGFSDFAMAPSGKVQDLSPEQDGDDVQLTWSETTGASSYNIYSGTEPYFTSDQSGGTNRVASGVTEATWTDEDATGNPSENNYYIVHAVSSTSTEGEASDRVGEFDFELISNDTRTDYSMMNLFLNN
ncbi:C10 family peptidase, partial [bacterium]|nr:C10 family peptidase [bacterium]